MKVYTAARYARMDEMREVVTPALEAEGHVNTARWTRGDEKTMTPEAAAEMDLEDVRAADVVLFFSEPLGSENRGGGRHFELGYGYLWGCHIVAVGDRETVFHNLAKVRVVPTLEDAVRAITEIEAAQTQVLS